MLLSLQREVKMEPGILGDHSDYSHCLSLRGTEDGPPCPRLGLGSRSCPLNNTPLRVGGLALDTSCLWARMSRSLIHQACCHSPPHQGGRTRVLPHHHGDPEGGSLHDAASLGLRPAGGCTLPAQRTFSHHPRSGQRSGTCGRRSVVSCPGRGPPALH